MKTTKALSVQFAAEERGLIKDTLLCRTGKFDGMYGEVEVTKDLLEALCARYIEQKQSPTNANDYAPILLDHDRSVENVMGRLLSEDLHVDEWKEIDGEMTFGLFGKLRIDDPAAQQAVDSGKYAQVSISFDEESNEIFEVSFVAVEAARGSIVLKQGEKKVDKKFQALSQKHIALATQVKHSRARRKAALSKLANTRDGVVKEMVELQKQADGIALAIKTSQTKAQFAAFVKQGKMNPSEIKALDFKELASLSNGARKIVLSAYENRAVSTDVFQFGQAAGKEEAQEMTPAKMRERIALQRAGKGANLAAGEADEDKEKKELAEEDGEDKEKKHDDEMSYSMSEDEHAEHMEKMTEVHQKLGECIDKIKSMGEPMQKMADADKDEEKKEMSDDGDSEDMGAEEDEDKKPKEKEEGK